MGKLFDKPMSELREAFVRARFAEPAMFGREDIEEWLDNPAFDTVSFDRAPEFLRHFSLVWKDVNLSWVLRTKATPQSESPEWFLWRIQLKSGYDRNAMNAIIATLQLGGAQVYYPWNNVVGHGPVVLIENDVYSITYPIDTFDPIMCVRKTDVRAVLEILNGEINNQRPKMDEVRTYFKTEAGKAISIAREAAQRDFDEAVAVSADGTKIVKAQWVFVVGANTGNRRGTLFPASELTEKKAIVREPIVRKEVFNYDVDSPVRFYMHSRPRGEKFPPQWLYTIHPRNGTAKILIINRNDFPHVLPLGGREIVV